MQRSKFALLRAGKALGEKTTLELHCLDDKRVLFFSMFWGILCLYLRVDRREMTVNDGRERWGTTKVPRPRSRDITVCCRCLNPSQATPG